MASAADPDRSQSVPTRLVQPKLADDTLKDKYKVRLKKKKEIIFKK